MNYGCILYQVENGIASITINRPDKLNALNRQTLTEIDQAVRAAQADKAVSGIIITGAGEKAFAAGADISEFASFSIDKGTDLSARGHAIFNNIENSPKPVIAAVNGFALGGGCELAMACHMRLASANARFGQPEVNLGLIPGYAGTQRLVQLVGKGKALELLLTADAIKADEAHRLGLVNHVVENVAELLPKAIELLQKIATKGPNAVAHCIALVNDYFDKEEDGFQNEIETFGSLFQTPEFKEGTAAFLEKRTPNFRG
jgi:enoyl-CoA hydratase